MNFAVFSANAEQIELCLFSADGAHETARIPLPERTGDVWHVHLAGLAPGALYGLRVHGRYAPEEGHRFNPHKLLMDPYARQLHGTFRWADTVFGYTIGSDHGDLSCDRRDSAAAVPKCVVTDPNDFDWGDDRPPDTAWDRTVIYEGHTRGLTMGRDDVPEHQRGLFAGVASDAMLDHLTRLGITAIELLPVHAFLNEHFLDVRRLRNYWGYNSIGFFALQPRYLGKDGIAGFQKMVRRFHAAGIEVILDVVYNHTAEGAELGPTLSFRGLDNASYYWLHPDNPRYYVNDTGCGNTLQVLHPFVLRMVLDSLRYWVGVMHVDGFRFDLGTTLGRERYGFDPCGRFFDALGQDPVLSRVKMIAEAWDVGPGGYQVGSFPAPFAEWNDRFRDTVRQFWRGDASKAQVLSDCLLGSALRFDHSGRRTWSSVNFITAHDGFTLKDLVSYNRKRNHANGENDRDGAQENYSSNGGVSGKTSNSEVLQRRARRKRNMLATLMFSQGTPMLLAGDEAGNSQGGNNNAYCQDNAIGWIDWSGGGGTQEAFLRLLIALRHKYPVLRQSRFLHGYERDADGRPDVEWFGADGAPPQWNDPELRQFGVLLRRAALTPAFRQTRQTLFLAINGGNTIDFALPPVSDVSHWHPVLDTSMADGVPASAKPSGSEVEIGHDSLALFVLTEDPT